MNKQVEGWEYLDHGHFVVWVRPKARVAVYRFPNERPKWKFLNFTKSSKWEHFPRHVNTLEKRLEYALAVCRLEG